MSNTGIPGFEGLFADTNKVKSAQREEKEGVVSSPFPELELDMKDEELLKLTKDWTKGWGEYQSGMKKKWENNEKYWKGQNKVDGQPPRGDDEKPNADNLIFEALETFLPLATQRSPDPVVEGDNTPQGISLARKTQQMLTYLSRQLDLKLTMKAVVRDWSLYFLGCVKVGWSQVNNEISVIEVRPQKLILDKDATVRNGEYTGKFIGEIRRNTASELTRIFPSTKKWLPEAVDGKMGTEINFTEWWTDEFVFWTFKDKVLDKKKNPHWNYDTEVPQTDGMGNQTMQTAKGKNHFAVPKKPYVFLSVFNLGLHPFDETGLIHQNLRTQDLISKRLKQIDQNADNTNGGAVVSGDHFTKEQAAKVGEAKRRGETVWVPSGDINSAYRQDVGPGLPPFVYQSLQDYRAEFKNVFGISGSTSGSQRQEKSVRGKIMSKQHDVDRIGGGFIEFLEQFSENTYNWFVQLMHVYYDEPHVATVIGMDRAKEYISLQNTDFVPKLIVSVKDGSLIPKDAVSKRNEAIELWAQHAIDPITLFEMLDDADPRGRAQRLFIWMTNPMALFPELQQQQQPQQPGQPGAASPPQPGNPAAGQQGAGRPQLPGNVGESILSSVPMTPVGE